MNREPTPEMRPEVVVPGPREALDEDHMQKISALITQLQSTMDQFGDTCVYIRRGGLSWGAVALNYRDDDKKYGVFDLQTQHDRDMLQRAEQVERLIASKNKWMERATRAEGALSAPVPPADGTMDTMNEALARQYSIPDELWKDATKDNPKVPLSEVGVAAWQNIDRITDALEAAGCCRNGQVMASEDHVANTIRNWLRSLPSGTGAAEPVGWLWHLQGDIEWKYSHGPQEPECWKIRQPVYTQTSPP